MDIVVAIGEILAWFVGSVMALLWWVAKTGR